MVVFASQTRPQAPQFELLVASAKQPPGQQLWPGMQAGPPEALVLTQVHFEFTQLSAAPQTTPQAPQSRASLAVLTQPPAQQLWALF